MSLSSGAVVPLGDTFVVAGGYSPEEGYSNAILQFDPDSETFFYRAERLSERRGRLFALAVGADKVSCS